MAPSHRSGAGGRARVWHSSGLLFTHVSEQGRAIQRWRARGAELLLRTAGKPHLLGVCVKKKNLPTEHFHVGKEVAEISGLDTSQRRGKPQFSSASRSKRRRTILSPVPGLPPSPGEAPGLADNSADLKSWSFCVSQNLDRTRGGESVLLKKPRLGLRRGEPGLSACCSAATPCSCPDFTPQRARERNQPWEQPSVLPRGPPSTAG